VSTAEGLSDWHQIRLQKNNPSREEGVIMLRELPETELSDNSDYERWYFEGQRAAGEAEGREAHKVSVGRKLNDHRPSQRGRTGETAIQSSSTF
jgi:hypothetical protein